MFEGQFRELLGVTHEGAFRFFYEGLREVAPNVRPEDARYPASVLAHYSQVSCYSDQGFSCPRTLADVFNNFVETSSPYDSEICETAGSQCLMFAGFFRSQMKNRHNVSWYLKLGIGFYSRAAERTVVLEREAKMSKMSEQLPMWADVCHKLSLEFRDNLHFLNLPKPGQ